MGFKDLTKGIVGISTQVSQPPELDSEMCKEDIVMNIWNWRIFYEVKVKACSHMLLKLKNMELNAEAVRLRTVLESIEYITENEEYIKTHPSANRDYVDYLTGMSYEELKLEHDEVHDSKVHDLDIEVIATLMLYLDVGWNELTKNLPILELRVKSLLQVYTSEEGNNVLL